MMGVTFGYLTLCIALIAVACTQFDKLKAAMLAIRKEHITPHHGQEDEHNVATVNCNLQAKLNACIRHNQDIIL